MYTLFLITTDFTNFKVFGAEQHGHLTLFLFKDEQIIDQTFRLLPDLSVIVTYEDKLKRLISGCCYSHVCIDQDSRSQVPKEQFLASLSSHLN